MRLCCLLMVLLLWGCYARVPEKTGLEGKPIPHFTILYPDSTTYFNTEHIALGTPAVFVYFGPYCVFSRAQTQEIVDNMDKMKDIHFYFVSTGDIKDLRDFAQNYHLDKYPNVTIGQDYTKFFADHYEASVVPFIAIYTKDGKLNSAFVGKVSPRQIKNCAQG